jgi:acyl-CoA synthetase (AMP-forming)/AMP-acid ligase II
MTVDAVARARSQALGDLLRRSARRTPDKLALVAGGRRFTYAELDAAVNRTAAALDARGIARGERLALLSHNGWEFAVVSFATARLGVVLVPINFMLTASEIAGSRSRRARSARSSTARRTRRSATSPTKPRPRRRSATAGSTPATSA